MGDCQNEDLRVSFDSRLKLKFLGSQVTTDAELLAYRELDEALGLTGMASDVLTDSRQGSNKQHGLSPLLRQSIYGRLAGYEDVNDAERLCVDPAMRHVVSGRASQPEKRAASTSEVGRFETETLSTKSNLTALMDLSGHWIDQVHQRQPLKQLILDLDSSVSCRTFKDNQTRLQLFALAYNLGNFPRRLALPKPVRHWSLTTLREKLIMIGAKVTRHAKYVTFQLAEVAVTRNLFAAILARIARLAIPPPVVGLIRV